MQNKLKGAGGILFFLLATIAFTGCDLLGLGANSGAIEDPTDSSDWEVFKEVDNPEPVPDAGGNSWTYWIRDADTNEPITSDVTLEVKEGTPPPLNSDGSFTLTSEHGGRFRVIVPGYNMLTEFLVENGRNIIYKQKLYQEMIGEWILFGEIGRYEDLADASPVDREERVEFGSEGIERWSGGYLFQMPESYYTTSTHDEYGRVFARINIPLGEKHWASIGNVPNPVMLYVHLLRYDEEHDILRRPTRDGQLLYSRDGTNPFDGGSDDGGGGTTASGTVSFNGASESVTSAFGESGTWGIVTSSYTIAVVNAPSSGTVSVDSSYYTGYDTSAVAVQISDSAGNVWVASSGSLTVSGSSIEISTSMQGLYDLALGGGETFALSVSAQAGTSGGGTSSGGGGSGGTDSGGTDSGGTDSGGTTTTGISVWTSRSDVTGYIDVYIGGTYRGRLTSYFSSGTPEYGQSGTLTVELSPGTYSISAQAASGGTWGPGSFSLQSGDRLLYELR
jgi:hypothetical protein